MLVEALLALVIGPLASCDTARAALGSCTTQLSTSLGSGQSFSLNLSRETSLPGSQSLQPGSSTVISAPVASTPAPTTVVSSPQPAAAPKPKTTTTPAAAPKPASSPKPTTAPKPTVSSVSKPAAPASVTTGCPVLDPPQARLYMPPCPSSSPAPKPAAKPAVAKPAAPAAPATSVARPVQAPPLVQTVSSPAVSTRTPSRSVTERDEFAARVPTPRLTISSTTLRVGAEAEFQVLASAVTNAGSLLGQAAEIRFTPIAALIATGDGATPQGFSATHRYREVGVYSARAVVSYRVDYRLSSGNWVLNAAILDSSSSSIAVQVLEPRKRTLLVD